MIHDKIVRRARAQVGVRLASALRDSVQIIEKMASEYVIICLHLLLPRVRRL
jgi:hypothetical protein